MTSSFVGVAVVQVRRVWVSMHGLVVGVRVGVPGAEWETVVGVLVVVVVVAMGMGMRHGPVDMLVDVSPAEQ